MNSKAHKWIIAGIIAVPVLLLFFLIAAAVGIRMLKSGAAALPSFKRIAVVRIEGVITESNWYVQLLRSYRSDQTVAGVLLRIDSPGGAVAPSQEIYSEVLAYRNSGKPLVVSMGNMAASGGYYIACPAEKIFASPGTLTGSIGVIFTLPLYQELTKKLGIEFRVLKAGSFKDLGSPYRGMNDKETKIFQDLLNDTHEQFISDVCAGRGMEPESLRTLADGRIFTGKQALEYRLVDSLGGYEDALGYLRSLSGVSERSRVLERKQRSGWREILTETAHKQIPALGTLSKPAGLYYLFHPY